jgi:phosphoenolpyruvate carboxylase
MFPFLFLFFFFFFFQDVQDSSNSESSFQDSSHGCCKSITNGSTANSDSHQSAPSPRGSFTSSQLLAQRKLLAESKIVRSSFQKLLEPSLPQRPGIAPYRIVLGHVKDKVLLLSAASNLSNT